MPGPNALPDPRVPISIAVGPGRFTSPSGDPESLAQALYALCPDSVDEGVGELEHLAERLAESGEFYLWWD